MSGHTIDEVIESAERFKLFILHGEQSEVLDHVSWIQSLGIKAVNIGKEVSVFLDALEDYSYLTIDVIDFIKKLLENSATKINGSGNDVLAIYNLGVLLEPQLELNAALLLKEFSKTTSLIIIWEHQFEMPNRLFWNIQQPNVSLDFSDAQLKQLQYAL